MGRKNTKKRNKPSWCPPTLEPALNVFLRASLSAHCDAQGQIAEEHAEQNASGVEAGLPFWTCFATLQGNIPLIPLESTKISKTDAAPMIAKASALHLQAMFVKSSLVSEIRLGQG